MKKVKLMLGDNMESLKKLPDNSVDSIVSDPPYGLSFMGKKWDYDVPSVEFWKEVYRVLKPGGHVLSFGGTRTYHRMVVNIEDAGFEIRDQVMWLYGSGFPKSHNISKAISKINGEDVKVSKAFVVTGNLDNNKQKGLVNSGQTKAEDFRHIPTTEEAIKYEGWGTALKPANEPICVARKPLSEKTIAENVIKWGTGGINIDGCRIGSDTITTNGYGDKGFVAQEGYEPSTHEGRFPANIILDETAAELLDEQSGISGSGSFKKSGGRDRSKHDYNSVGDFGSKEGSILAPDNYGDKGGASRFFYVAKVSKKERNLGLDGIILQLSNLCISIDYNNKEVKLWESTEQKARHQEVMELLTQRGIDELQLKKVMENTICEWNTGSYGNNTTDLYQMATTFITLMATNLITELKILNVLVEQNTNESISECILKTDFGGSIVANVMSGNQKNIIIEQKKDGCQVNVNLVELKQQLKISVKENKNIHATIKPINLMTYLCRLVTPEGGIVLDPFMGSGSTGISALLEGFRFIGMEMDEDYFKIASARIEAYEEYRKLLK